MRGIELEYNINKSKINIEKHGIDFEKAKQLWEEDNLIIPTTYVEESRYLIIGMIEDKFYTAVYTMRNDKYRIISCRRSREIEKRWFYENQD